MKTIDVAIHMSLNTFHRLDITQGVIQYAREHAQWRIHGSFYTSKPILNYKTWQGRGIISLCHYRDEAKDILPTGLPIVDVIHGFTDDRVVYVTSDHEESGRIAARHFQDLGFSRFAFCHISGLHWSTLCGEAFARTVGVPLSAMPVFERRLGWWQNHHRFKALEKFLLALPPRTAVFAANDNAGVKVTAACAACGRRIPEDLAVMGNGGDSLQCELSYPPLSTVPNNGLRIGYEAARRLDALMRDDGDESLRRTLRVMTDRPELRRSTDTMVCEDEAVQRALLFIRRNYNAAISVDDVAREAAVCRRTLELRFRRHLDRTVLEEMHAVRMRHARSLLEDTDLPVSTIFRRCGFMTHQVFYSMFRRRYGLTPAEYRRRHAARPGAVG